MMCLRIGPEGFTFIELMLGASILAIVVVAVMGGYLGRSFLNTNSRHLMAAMNDATRVMEQIRLQNVGDTCLVPSAAPPASFQTWDAWLAYPTALGGGGKSIMPPVPNDVMERVAVTCQDQDGGTDPADYCGSSAQGLNPAQVGTGEWHLNGRGRRGGNTTLDPIRVTVAVGWCQQMRAIGGAGGGVEFTANYTSGGNGPPRCNLSWGPDSNNNGVIESQAMLTTLVTCR